MVENAPTYPASTIAKLLNLTERRIQQLAKDGIIPKSVKGKYDLIGCVRGYIRYLQDRAFGQDIGTVDYHQEKARLTKLQADEKALLVEQLRGKLLLLDDVSDAWIEMIANARAKLLGIPTKIAARLAVIENTAEVENFLKEVIYEALTELANHHESELKRVNDLDNATTGDSESMATTT